MRNSAVMMLCTLCLSILTPAANASDYFAHLSTRFDAGNCSVFSWITIEGERQKLEFPGDASLQAGRYHCTVNIPAEDFEQYFASCFLTGLVFSRGAETRRDGLQGISFSGVPENTVGNKYFFEWFDAEHTDAEYLCLVRRN